MLDSSMTYWIAHSPESLVASRQHNFSAKALTGFAKSNVVDYTWGTWEFPRFSSFTCFDIIHSVVHIICSYAVLTVCFASFCSILYALLKLYYSPVAIIKDLTDVGFDHVTGNGRRGKISRARNARKLGAKLPPPYPNGWFALLESRELKVGDVRAIDALGENFCVYRSADGLARCVHAYCPHLGANLAVGGSVVGDCIQCPFHKWRFSGESGACVSVPDLESPPRGVSVRKWRTCEAAGAVWVWFDVGGGTPPRAWRQPATAPPAGWSYRGRNQYIVNCHIQDIPENGADVAHLNAVHSPSIVTNIGEKHPFLLNLIGRHVWAAEWSPNGVESHKAHMKLTHEYRFGKLGLGRVKIDATQMGPGAVSLFVRTAAGPMLLSQSVTPLSPCEQLVVHRIFSPWWNAPVAALFIHAEAAMFERDLVIWNSKQFVSSPSYVRTDKSIRAFRSWYSQFYSDGSLSFRQATARHRDPFDW